MARSKMIPAADLVEDLDLYPRAGGVDDSHVRDIVHALEAGVQLPPVVADRASGRLVDGWHRRRGVLKHSGPDARIAVEYRDYASEAEMFEDAFGLNAAHGRKLTAVDHVQITIRARELGIPLSRVAVLLHKPEETVERLSYRTAQNTEGRTVALKRPLARLSGTTLTSKQEMANRRASGWSIRFHAAQIADALEAGTADLTTDTRLALLRLRDALGAMDLEEEVVAEAS